MARPDNKPIATAEQVEGTLEILKQVPDKPPLLTRDDVLRKLAPAIRRLHKGRHTFQEITDLINSAQPADGRYITIRLSEVRRIIRNVE